MRFSIDKWHEVKPNAEHKAPDGALRLICSDPGALVYLSSQGYEVLAAVGHHCDLTFKEEMTYRVVCKKDATLFVYLPRSVSYEPAGEVFTNIDREPQESGTLLEVRKELRRWHLEQRGERQAMAAQLAELRAARAAVVTEEPDQQEPEAEPDEEEAESLSEPSAE